MLGPLSPLLQHLAGSQLSATLLAVAGSLATALFSFVALPVMDWLLGRDLRAPSEVTGRVGRLPRLALRTASCCASLHTCNLS